MAADGEQGVAVLSAEQIAALNDGSRVGSQFARICESHEALRAQRDELALHSQDAVNQACADKDGLIDSMALSAYADVLRLFAEMGMFTIEREHGRRVIGRWATRCDHKFIDSTHCLKCGWKP